MKKRMTFTALMLIFSSLFMSFGVGLTFYNLPAKKTALQKGAAYTVKSKSGTREYRGVVLKGMIHREERWAPLFAGLIVLLLMCAVISLKWEIGSAVLAACCTLGTHLYLFIQLGFAEYQALNGMVFAMSVMPFLPVPYVWYMRKVMAPPPDAPSD